MPYEYNQNQFVEHFAEVAADSDYSRLSDLQATTPHDIEAAAHAMWQAAVRRVSNRDELYRTLDAVAVERALRAKVVKWDDSGHLVSYEFEEYWDATDEQNFSFGLREQIERELFWNYKKRKESEGLTVVETPDGIWLFNMKEAM